MRFTTITQLITPLRNSGAIDYRSCEELISRQKRERIDAVILGGSVGEDWGMSRSEIATLCQKACKFQSSEFAVLFHLTGTSVQKTLEKMSAAANSNLAGWVLSIPKEVRLGREEVETYIMRVTNHTKLPVYLHIDESINSANIDSKMIIELHKMKNINGVLLACDNLGLIGGLKEADLKDFRIIGAKEEMYLAHLSLGVHGLAGVSSNIIPQFLSNLMHAYESGNMALARKIQNFQFDLIKLVKNKHEAIAVKASLAKIGLCKNVVREPLMELNADILAELNKELRMLDLIPNDTEQVEAERFEFHLN